MRVPVNGATSVFHVPSPSTRSWRQAASQLSLPMETSAPLCSHTIKLVRSEQGPDARNERRCRSTCGAGKTGGQHGSRASTRASATAGPVHRGRQVAAAVRLPKQERYQLQWRLRPDLMPHGICHRGGSSAAEDPPRASACWNSTTHPRPALLSYFFLPAAAAAFAAARSAAFAVAWRSSSSSSSAISLCRSSRKSSK